MTFRADNLNTWIKQTFYDFDFYLFPRALGQDTIGYREKNGNKKLLEVVRMFNYMTVRASLKEIPTTIPWWCDVWKKRIFAHNILHTIHSCGCYSRLTSDKLLFGTQNGFLYFSLRILFSFFSFHAPRTLRHFFFRLFLKHGSSFHFWFYWAIWSRLKKNF